MFNVGRVHVLNDPAARPAGIAAGGVVPAVPVGRVGRNVSLELPVILMPASCISAQNACPNCSKCPKGQKIPRNRLNSRNTPEFWNYLKRRKDLPALSAPPYLSDVEEGGETHFPLEGPGGLGRLKGIDYKQGPHLGLIVHVCLSPNSKTWSEIHVSASQFLLTPPQCAVRA